MWATVQSSYFSRREAEEKKDETKKPTSTENKSDTKRPQRDVTGQEQPQKQGASQPTSSTGTKKEEKRQKWVVLFTLWLVSIIQLTQFYLKLMRSTSNLQVLRQGCITTRLITNETDINFKNWTLIYG